LGVFVLLVGEENVTVDKFETWSLGMMLLATIIADVFKLSWCCTFNDSCLNTLWESSGWWKSFVNLKMIKI
jgi:hypothetical protein